MKVVTFETTDGKVRYLLVDAGGVPIEEVRQFLKFEDNRGMARNTLKQKCIHLKHFYTFLQQRRIKYKDVNVDDLAAYIPVLKIPVREEVASLLKTLIDEAKGKSTDENNPDKYLFNTYEGKNKGLPYSKPAFTSAVQDLINRKNILDGNGEVYHFKTHSLRHTRAMEYTEQGMPIGIIQQILGHCSLQMTLHYSKVSEDMLYSICPTKTNAGTRKLPITEDVAEMFKAIIQDRPKNKVEKMVDGYSGFLYTDDNGMPLVAMHWEHRFNNMVGRYNEIYKVQIPNITPHVCRHTYCTNMAKSGMNPKTLQYLMGHSDIGVTMNVYTHLGLDDAKDEMIRMEELEQARREVQKGAGEKPITQKAFKVV